MRRVRVLAALAVLVVFLFILPTLDLPTFGILPSSTGMPGSLRLLAIVVITAALAVTFDLLLGQTGLLSFGHAVYFAGGSYVFAMMLNYTSLSFWAAAPLAVVAVFAASLLLGMVSLRVEGLAYAMVTLAFLELASVMVTRGYFGTNGESGLRLPSAKVPEYFIGIRNVSNVYSLAVVVSVVVIASAALLTRTRFGLVLRGMRDNPLRMRVLGYDVYWTKLVIMGVSSGMAAICGVAYTIILSGADPTTTTMTFSLSLMFMVVIGGSGSVAGAAVGGAVYALLLQRLPALGDSVAGSGPAMVSDIVREPQLLLGVIFLAVVFLAPAGIRGLVSRAGAGLATAARNARPSRPRADASH